MNKCMQVRRYTREKACRYAWLHSRLLACLHSGIYSFWHGYMTTRPKASMHAYGHSVSDTRGMTPKIITVWAPKGGVGKTPLAYEVASRRTGPAIDCEWNRAPPSYRWGRRDPEPVEKARLIRAF